MPRLVYPLLFETERKPGAEIVEFVVNLTLEGKSMTGSIVPIGEPRIVDLRPGDHFLHVRSQKRYKLAHMSAYRQHQISEEKLAADGGRPKDIWCRGNDRWCANPACVR